MQPAALIGATVAALLGAVAWAVISALTGYEIGYVAWAIGGLVGLGAMLLGGRGATTGMACAAMALISIFAGKMFAVQYAAPTAVREALAEHFTLDLYTEYQKDAEDFARLTDESQHAEFMVSHQYTEASEASGVTEDELADFRESSVPILRDMKENNPPFEEWQSKRIDPAAEAVLSELSITKAVIDDLGLIDIVFGLLGVATAYRVGSGTAKS